MGNTYRNENGVYIDVHTDKNGKDHVSFYDRDPRDPEHESFHVNWDSDTGKGNIVESNDSGKTSTDTSCFLTTACMKFLKENFKDNCNELTILRWFRDNFVSKDDIEHYYDIAPIIVSVIENMELKEKIYNYIYNDVILVCINAIKNCNYEFAYNRYKNCVLALEEEYARPFLGKKLVKILKLNAISV